MAEVDFMSAKEMQALELLRSLENVKEHEEPAPLTDYDRKLGDWLALNDNKDSAKLNIYALSAGQNSNEEFVESLPVDKYDFEGLHAHIKKKWGAGDYRVRIREGKKWVINQYLSVREALDEKTPSTDMTGVVGQLLDQIKRLNERPKSDGNDRMAFLQEMLIMKQLFSTPQQSNGGGLNEMLGLITGLKNAGLISTPNDEKDVTEKDGFMGFLSSMAPTLETIAKNAMQRPQMPAPMHQPQYAQPAPQPVSPAMGDEIKAMITMALMTLCHAAEKNAEQSIYVTWVLDQLPDEHLDEFFELLDSDDWLDTLDAMSYGKAKLYTLWFTGVRNAILAELTDDNGQTDTDPER
jgi:hypothetical protein